MASVLVDLEDISYIDDITDDDDDVIDEEEDNSKKAKKRKKNRLVGEKLIIDPNDKLVKELRQERRESKKVLDSVHQEENQTSRDLEKLRAFIKDQEKQKIIQDLRQERAKLNSDLVAECSESLVEINDESFQFGSIDEFYLYHPKQNKMTKENKEKMNKDTDNNDKKRRSTENMSSGNENAMKANETETKVNVENYGKFEKNVEYGDVTDAQTEEGPELGEFHQQFNEKSKLVQTDSKSESRPKGKRQKPSDEGKENVNVASPNTCESKDKDIMMNNDNENDTTYLLMSKIPDNNTCREITEKEKSDFNGAKPKLITRRVNGHDMQLKELDLELYPSTETSKKSGKGKSSKKKKSKAPPEASEQNLQSTGSDIKILVTDVEGTELVAHMSDSTTGTSRDTWNCKSGESSQLSSPSDATNTSNTRKSTPLNYLRKMSEDNEGKKNNLIEQAELYKQQKAKPFQKLAKIKSGLFSTGIEGDSKRSYIKALAIMPDKKFITYDRRNKCLKLFDEDFNPLDKVNLTTKYCGLAAIFDETFVATLPTTKKLQFYHIDNDANKICQRRTYPIEGEFYSITYHRHRLYLIQRIRTHHFTEHDEWEIKKLNINKNTEEMKTLRKFSPGHKDCNLLTNDRGVYLTNRLENEVLMLKHDGTLQYRHRVEFSLPVGITSDKFGNIYVCGGSMTSFIEVIKPDLQRYRIIYKKTSSNPAAMCFDQEDSILYVSDQILGRVIKYRIQHAGTIHGLMGNMLINSPSKES